MKISAIITLKKDVLDPQGKVIHQALDGMGFEHDEIQEIVETAEQLQSDSSIVHPIINKLVSNMHMFTWSTVEGTCGIIRTYKGCMAGMLLSDILFMSDSFFILTHPAHC